jgi:uncharacterized CHY-type Zn-finger protein
MSKAISNMWSKLWCHHQWKSHAHVEYTTRESKNVEILICTECGKIHTLIY